MKVLVVGKRGFIGSHLAARLTKEGYEVVTERPQDCALIINCAAELTDEKRMGASNVNLVVDLLDALRTARAPGYLIHLGSSAETGPVEGARREDLLCLPSNHYEVTKHVATQLCLSYAKAFSLDVSVVRPFTVYGSGDKPRKLLPSLWRAWKDGSEFTCYPGGHDWIHIDDFVEGVMALIKAPRASTRGQVFNLGTGVCTPNAEIVRLFSHYAGRGGVRVLHSPAPYHPYDVTDWRADITKALAVLGWSPQVSVEAGVRRFVEDQWFAEEKAPGL